MDRSYFGESLSSSPYGTISRPGVVPADIPRTASANAQGYPPEFILPIQATGLGAPVASPFDFENHLATFASHANNAHSFENFGASNALSEPASSAFNAQGLSGANFEGYLPSFHPAHNVADSLLQNSNGQQNNQHVLTSVDTSITFENVQHHNSPPVSLDDLQRPDNIANMFRMQTDAAINSIPSDSKFQFQFYSLYNSQASVVPLLLALGNAAPIWRRFIAYLLVKAWSHLCQEKLTPRSSEYWRSEIKRLYVEFLTYPTEFELGTFIFYSARPHF